MKKKKQLFEGMNKIALEAEVEIRKKEIGDRYIGERLLSVNPKYQIELEYWEEDK